MDDLVSRQEVLRRIKESRENIDWGQSEDGDAFLHYSAALYRTIASKKCLPSAQPKRKKGHWISQDYNKSVGSITTAVYYLPRCSVCGLTSYDTNYCPNCGADMRGEQDE